MNVRLLSKILPGWEFAERDNAVLFFRSHPIVWRSTDNPADVDHLCGEVERALLKDERVCWVRVLVYDDGSAEAQLGSGYEGTKGSKIIVSRGGDTKLDALLAAAEPLMEGA